MLRGPGGGVSPSTAEEYIQSFHDGRPLRLRHLVNRIVAAVATLGTGGALGLEGPSIYIGSTLGSVVQRRFGARLHTVDRNVLLVAGAAARLIAAVVAELMMGRTSVTTYQVTPTAS